MKFAEECEDRLKIFWQEAKLGRWGQQTAINSLQLHGQAASVLLEAMETDVSLAGDAFLELYSGEGGTDAMDWPLKICRTKAFCPGSLHFYHWMFSF